VAWGARTSSSTAREGRCVEAFFPPQAHRCPTLAGCVGRFVATRAVAPITMRARGALRHHRASHREPTCPRTAGALISRTAPTDTSSARGLRMTPGMRFKRNLEELADLACGTRRHRSWSRRGAQVLSVPLEQQPVDLMNPQRRRQFDRAQTTREVCGDQPMAGGRLLRGTAAKTLQF